MVQQRTLLAPVVQDHALLLGEPPVLGLGVVPEEDREGHHEGGRDGHHTNEDRPGAERTWNLLINLST